MLMKNEISIITPHSVYNYGAMLQAYGIYQFIKKMDMMWECMSFLLIKKR